MSTKRISDDLGKMGENTFLLLCKDTGFIANSSDDDKGGWDIEIENFRGDDFCFSNHSYFVGRIQVKASQTFKMSVSLTFSNLLNLIQFSGAAFVMYFEYGDDGILPSRGYLREIDKSLSREILVTIRERQLKNKNFRLNKNKYTVKFGNQHLISMTGSSLRESINRYVGKDFKEYIVQKVSYLNSFERETGLFGVTLNISGGEPNIKRFVDALIGFDISFQGVSQIYSTTMGIVDSENQVSSQDATEMPLKIGPKEDLQPIVTVSISLEPHGKQYHFPGRLFSTPSFIPEELSKHRIKTPLFDLVLETVNISGELCMKPSFKFTDIFQVEVITTIKEFSLLNELMLGSRTTDAFYVAINSADKEEKMAPMKLSYKEPIFPEEFEYFKGAVDALYNRASRLNLNDAMISSRELRDKQEKLYLYSKDKFEFAEPVTMEFGDERTQQFSEKEIKLFDSVIFSCKINFFDKVLVSLYLFQGELSYGKNAAYSGRFKNADHVKDFVFEIDNSDIDNIVDEAEKFILQQFREKGLNPFDS